MKNQKVFQKVIFVALIVLILFSLVAPAIFSQGLPAPKQEKLLNGLKVLLWPDNVSSNVSISIRVHSGSAFDPQGKEGVMRLLADNIFPNDEAKEFFTEDLGGGLEIISNYDYIEINASSKPDRFITMMETVATALSNPVIDKEQTAKLRAALMTKVAVLEADPEYVADHTAARRLLGSFPYGRPQLGSIASLQKIDFADLVDAKERFLTADNATLAVRGNFERNLGFRAVRRYFGSWLKSDKKTPSTFRQPDEPATDVLKVISPKADVSAVRIALRGTARSDKDFAASMVFTNIIESRLKARAPAALSEKLSVRHESHTLPGLILIGFPAGEGDVGNSNGRIDVGELVRKAMSDPITPAEFRAAASAFQAAWAKRDLPSFWLDVDTYKLSSANAYAGSADTVTIAEVNTFAEKVRKAPLVTVVLTPAK